MVETAASAGGGHWRVFHVKPGASLAIRDLRIIDAGGHPEIVPAGQDWPPGRLGGAVFSQGALSIVDTKFSGNSAGVGGAIYVWGGETTISISSSEFSDNSAEAYGGAIFVAGGETTISISSSEFSGNSSERYGGAILVGVGETTISSSEFSGNSAHYDGGAILVGGGETTISSSEFSGNSAERTAVRYWLPMARRPSPSAAASSAAIQRKGTAAPFLIKALCRWKITRFWTTCPTIALELAV